MLPDESRFESDPAAVVGEPAALPDGWRVDSPDAADRFELARLTRLLRDHERHGRGWPGAGVDDVLVEVAEPGLRTRENVVVRDGGGLVRAWGSVHDRAWPSAHANSTSEHACATGSGSPRSTTWE